MVVVGAERHVVTLYPKKIEDSLLNSGQALETLTHWNKNDVRRKRLGPKDYIEHEKQILEKTLSEIFQDFPRFQKKVPRNCYEANPFLLCLLGLKIEILVVAGMM